MPDNILDWLHYKILPKVGLCTPTLADLNDYLQKSVEYVEYAENIRSFADAHPDLPAQLRLASAAIEHVHRYGEEAATAVADLEAACRISVALKELSDWAYSTNRDNAAAARAFDKLFGGVASYASKLPAPINGYARILEEISVTSFFTNMERLGASRAGGNDSNSTGSQMRQALDAIDNP